MSESRAGRFDLLFSDGLKLACSRLGISPSVAGPVIDRFVAQKVAEHKMPVTLEELCEETGIIEKRPKQQVIR